jgi:hypothetical protein
MQLLWWFFYMKVECFPFITIACQKLRYQSCWSQEHWHICQNRTIIKTTKPVQWSSVLAVLCNDVETACKLPFSFKLTTYACFELKQPSSQFIVCCFNASNIFSYVHNVFKDIYFFPSGFLTNLWYVCLFFPCMLHAMLISC